VLFVTPSAPHQKGDALAPMVDLMAGFVKSTMTGRKANQFKADLGWLGSIRAVEITYGRPPHDNGWHGHGHCLFFFDRVLSPAEVAAFRTWLFTRWQGVVTAHGLGTLHPVNGLDIRPVYSMGELSEYVACVEGGWSVGLELARADLKYKGQTPFDLLAEWAFNGDVESRDLWLEYEAATFNRRIIQWSPGLRARLLPDVAEVTDEEAASAEGEDEVCLTWAFPGGQWNQWVRLGEVAGVLREVECISGLFLWMAGAFRVSEAKEAVSNG
jgi:hypothetical protein